ncbi:MAG: hypothetical protein R3C44_11690 [Chloroflexota bacterium]
MIGAGWLNLGSLALGLIAWGLAIFNLVLPNKSNNKNWAVFSIMSLSACAVSLCLQIFYTNHLVTIEDWSALMDTSQTTAWVAAVLLIVTLILNAVTLLVYRNQR